MTSDEIARTKTIPDLVIAGESQSFWLRELALQMAKLNERNERIDQYNMEQDAKDAERADRKERMLPQFLEKANETMDRISPPPFFVRPVPGEKQKQ